MRSLTLIIAVAGAYALLRGWEGSPSLLLRACLAVATLVAGLAFWGIRRDSSHPRMFSLRKATWLDYLSLGAAVVFTEACFVVLTSTLAGPAQEMVVGVRDVISDPTKNGNGNNGSDNGEGDTEFDGEHSGDRKWNKNMIRDLPRSSNHKPSTKPEVFVELESAEDATALFNTRIHLRSFSFSKFNGISWGAIRKKETRLRAPISFPVPPKSIPQSGIKHRIYHSASSSGQNLFTALHGARSTDLPELTELAESIYRLPQVEDPADGYSYTATSSSIHFTDLISEPIKAAAGQPEELDLPPELADQLNETAESFIYEPTLATQLIALRSFLQDNYKYSLETTNAAGANPLENFLYLEKRGYCEHFATAAAMLCRTLGLPSRIAYGWSGGRLYKAQNMFVFRAKDAHAWTEIKLEGYGWVVFDTTPPDDEATPDTHAAPESEEAPDPTETIQEQHQSKEKGPPSPFKLNINPWLLYSSLGIIGIFSIAFLITRTFRQPPTAPDGRPLSCPPPSYLIHFKQTCAALGHPMPTGRTLRQHIDVLVNNNAAPYFSTELLDYHYGFIYADAPQNVSREKRLNKLIRKWKKSVSSVEAQTAYSNSSTDL